jgi:muconolactone D-isomerase
MLYHLEFQVEYAASMTQQDLFRIWSEEAEVALDAKSKGVVIGLWKCVGTRKVIAILDVDSPDTLDQITLDLPIMKQMGQHVHIQVTPLRTYESFTQDLNARLN